MCGIFGLWSTQGDRLDLAKLEAATNILRHRGPDDEGYLLVNTILNKVVPCKGNDSIPEINLPHLNDYHNEFFNLAFGFRRLSILDLSPNGHQPMSTADNRFWIMHNGEIYNYVELRNELIEYGFSFKSGTDTEVILNAYQLWGEKCLDHFNGMWAFAIWDNKKGELFIARDRFGIKPLYYSFMDGFFAFASEIKALTFLENEIRPNDKAVFKYLTCGKMIPSGTGETFFADIFSLPPGYYMKVKDGLIKKQKYWNLIISTPVNSKKDDLIVEGYKNLFQDSVRLRLRSDVSIGTCLSGGLDSTSIVCLIDLMLRKGESVALSSVGNQKTFSAVYNSEGKFNEFSYIKKVISNTNVQAFFVCPNADNLFDQLGKIVYFQDEPFQSTSILAQWLVMDLVHSEGIKVLLDGQGADEVLAGYRPFVTFLADQIRRLDFFNLIGEARSISKMSERNFADLLAKAFLRNIYVFALNLKLTNEQCKPFDDSALNENFKSSLDFTADFFSRYKHKNSYYNNLNEYLRSEMQDEILPNLLRYEDRNSMAFGIESRLPFLDYRLVEYSFNEAAHLRIKNGWTKFVLRQAMAGIIPKEIAWRKDKVGFETPEEMWLKEWFTKNKNYFSKTSQVANYLSLQYVQSKIDNWLDDNQSCPEGLWRWLNLELWLKNCFSKNKIN